MADIVAIEPEFGQQVAAEALKNISKRKKRFILDSPVQAAESPEGKSNSWEGRKNGHMKCETSDAHTLVRTQTIHLRLDSQLNLPGLVIPIGISVDDVPACKSSRHDVNNLHLRD